MLTAILHTVLPDSEVPPEWLHLVPAGTFRGKDGRGPWQLVDAAAVITASLAAGPLVLDENHATDHAAKTGQGAPAQGWIAHMEARPDGIWGRVDWTPSGQALVAARAYRGVSPVIAYEKSGRVLSVVRAALTNNPNLLQLKPVLNSQEPLMDPNKVREALGLAADADEAAVLAAITASRATVAANTALQSQVTTMAGEMVALQTQVSTAVLTAPRDRAAAAIDAAIKAGKPIPASLREHFIARHTADAASVETELAGMPSLHAGGVVNPPKPGDATKPDADEARVIAMLGVDTAAFLKEKARLGQMQEAV